MKKNGILLLILLIFTPNLGSAQEYIKFYNQYADNCGDNLFLSSVSADFSPEHVPLYLLMGMIISFDDFDIQQFDLVGRSLFSGKNSIYLGDCSNNKRFPKISFSYEIEDHNSRSLASVYPSKIDFKSIEPSLLKAPVHSPIQVVLDLLNLYAKHKATVNDWKNYDLAYRDIQNKLKEGEKVTCWVYFDSSSRFLGLLNDSVPYLLEQEARVALPTDSIPFSKVEIIGAPNLAIHDYTLEEELKIAEYIFNAIPIKEKTNQEVKTYIEQQYKSHGNASDPPAFYFGFKPINMNQNNGVNFE